MKIYEVMIEYTSSALDRPFSYFYNGTKPLEKYFRVLVEFNHRKIIGIVTQIKEVESIEEYSKKTGFQIKSIIDVIDNVALINEELSLLAQDVAKYYYSPLISVYFAMLPPSLKPSLTSMNKPQISYETFLKVKEGYNYDNLTTKQAEVLYKIETLGKIKKSEISPSICKTLLSKNKIEEIKEEKHRLKLDEISKIDDLKLTDEQQLAFDEIINSSKSTFLLEGVTGSGKTEVYIQSAKKIINEGKKVILLVPEITLTYQMVHRFQSRFDRIAILHSGLTPSQRYDEYRKIRDGLVDIVIGARSAIFAPLDNIGLIIIDEEHSDTYKQSDQLPYYHALEVAKMRQRQVGCKIVLGSATPSLETKSRALKGLYKQLLLTKRATNLPLPETKIIDMKSFANIDKISTLISVPLRKAIEDRLSKKEQVILLVNRRGFSPFVSCRKCGYLFKCPECQVALTYHKEDNQLVCHHCGFSTSMVNKCPKCESEKIFTSGCGSERIEEEVKKIFASARVLRLDSDISKKQKATKQILEQFEQNQADILVGTSIVSKGHDFSNVTLVGIVLADVGLAIPSFRASEATFSLIYQALGRSGRNKKGEALIQTYLPDSYVINAASKQDYLKFYSNEIRIRKMLQNPPYTYMCLLIISSENEDNVIDASYQVYNYLDSNKDESIKLIGPSELFIKKYQNKYRRKILLKYKNYDLVVPLLDDLRLMFTGKDGLTLTIDIDPYQDY